MSELVGEADRRNEIHAALSRGDRLSEDTFAGKLRGHNRGRLIDYGFPEVDAECEAEGARVVPVPLKGYGNALMGGIRAARGRYVVMGDADDSYDFNEVPKFVGRHEGRGTGYNGRLFYRRPRSPPHAGAPAV